MRSITVFTFFLSMIVVTAAWADGGLLVVKEKTKVYILKDKKLAPIGDVEPGTKLVAVKSVLKGKWFQVNYENQKAYILAKKVEGKAPDRDTASVSGLEEDVPAPPPYYPISMGANVGYSTSLSAPALGLAGFYNTKWLTGSYHQASLGAYFHYYLVASAASTAASTSAMSFTGLGRYQYHLFPKFDVGAEGGLSMVQSSASITILGTTVTSSATDMQLFLGAFARYQLSHRWQMTAGLRIFGVPNFSAGLEYCF